MNDWLPLLWIALWVLLALTAAFIAWKVLVFVAEIIVKIDRALFPKRDLTSRPLLAFANAPAAHGRSANEAPPFVADFLPQTGGRDLFHIEFDYVDREGERSRRAVRLNRFTLDTRGRAQTIHGVCSLSRSLRSFHVRSMSNVVCLDTGEIIDSLELWIKEAFRR